MRTFNRSLKFFSAVTLFFFCWSFLPLWQAVAWAVETQKSGVSSQKSGGSRNADFGMRNGKPEAATTGDRFEKALESIREKIGKAEEKASKNQDFTAEVAEVKAKRADIESADIEFRKEFATTEKKLKDAKLPKEILDRHVKFVKHYEDNLKELKANLDDIEKQKADSRQLRAALTKAKDHLEKTKAPSRHQEARPEEFAVQGKESVNDG